MHRLLAAHLVYSLITRVYERYQFRVVPPECTFVPLKTFFSILFCLILTSNVLVNLGTFLWYGLEKEYISQELCENKDNQSMNCDGACVIQKTMILQEQSNQQNEAQTISINLPVFIIPSLLGSSNCTLDELSTLVSPIPNIMGPYLDEILHPPRLS